MSDGADSIDGRARDLEAVLLTALIEAYPGELTETEVKRELTAVENTEARAAMIDQAVETLIAVGLVARTAHLLRPTPPALRAAELDLGL